MMMVPFAVNVKFAKISSYFFHVAIRTALIFFLMCATLSPKQRQNLLHSSD